MDSQTDSERRGTNRGRDNGEDAISPEQFVPTTIELEAQSYRLAFDLEMLAERPECLKLALERSSARIGSVSPGLVPLRHDICESTQPSLSLRSPIRRQVCVLANYSGSTEIEVVVYEYKRKSDKV